MQATAEKIWMSAQEHLRSMLSPDTYNLWFSPLRATGQENNSLVLEVANDFCEVWLKDNYLSLLQDVLTRAAGQPITVKLKIASGSTPAASLSHAAPTKAKPPASSPERTSACAELNFNPKYTFDSFVVG